METENTDSPVDATPAKTNGDPIPTPPKFLRAGCPSCRPTNMTGDFAAARFATAYSSGEVTRLDRS